MSPKAGQLLVTTIVPIIKRAIARGTARAVGAEDREELIADCIAQAARIIHAGEANGKELPAASVVYHALQRTKYGQRGPVKSITDVMAPRTQFKGRSTLVSMDALIGDRGGEFYAEPKTLHDVLAAPNEDAAGTAARRIDWEAVTQGMSGFSVDIICAMADGRTERELAAEHDVNVAKVQQFKREVKTHVREQWDATIIDLATREPEWKRRLRTIRERRECRAERAIERR